ncbi:MAG: sulfatase-like hydrolase/transferase, partial [Candidatus Sericytochromatia bacterium]|nr:sulfatase-like hydrolase/transferase [Candidatus Sericytochromatia bacterium]
AHAWHDSPPVVAFPELPAARADAPARIVLVTFDAWRYRSTAFASPERVAQTPHLAALGDESTVFDACRSPGDQTLVSLASLLTGVYPPQIFSTPHNRWYSVREGSLPHLGSLLKGAGYGSTYHTAWVNPTYFGRGSDFDDGRTDPWRPQVQFNTEAFLPWRALLAWAPHVISQRVNPWTLSSDAIYVTQLYVDSLTAPPRTASPRRFQWLHLPTPHVPYMKVPPALLGKRLNAAERQSISAHEVVPGGGPAELEAAYEGYVRFADAELGRLVQQLKDAGAWDDTMLVVTADHGEAHEGAPRLYHGFGEPVRDVVHVPLVIHFPGQRSGSRVRAPVSGIDLVPTLLDAVYGEVPTYLKGRSLMKGAHPPRRMVFSWCMPDPNQSAPQAAAIGGFDGRYEFVSPVLPAGPPRLYDTLGQPGLDVSAQQPELLRRFQAQMLNDCPPRWPSP